MTERTPKLDLRRDHWAIVSDILAAEIPERTVLAFGSRARWTAKAHSDLDLAILGNGKLPLDRMAALREAFEDSDLPFKVDLLDWNGVDAHFREVIRRDAVTLQEGAGVKAPNPPTRGSLGIAGEWFPATLGECIDVKHGFAFKGEFIHEEPHGDILLTPGNFAIGGGFKGDKFKYYSGPEVPEFILRQGDLLVSMTDLSKDGDTLGYPAFVPKSQTGQRYLHNQRLGKIQVIATTKIDTGFLHYLLCSAEYRKEILGSATGSTVRHTSPDRIKRFEFLRPRVAEQRAIAHILGTLDDRIEANRRMAATLEEMARALFRAWFVSFEPVRAKAEGRWRPGQSLPGLPASLYDAFPDRVVETEQGAIPEGWWWKPLPEIFEVNPSRVLRAGDDAAYLDMASVPTKGHRPQNVTRRPFGSGMKFRNGDTLLARITPCLENGKTAFVDFLADDETGWGSTEFIVLSPRAPWPKAAGYLLARDERFREFAIQSMTGTSGRQRVPASALEHFLVPTTGKFMLEAFGRFVQPWIKRSSAATAENSAFTAIRDLLLPKLVSGTVRVKDAEAFLKARGL